MRFTGLFVLVSVPLEVILGLIIALVLNERLPLRGLMRAAVLVPWAIPAVVSGRIFELIYNYSYGAANYVLSIAAPDAGTGQLAGQRNRGLSGPGGGRLLENDAVCRDYPAGGTLRYPG